MILIKKSEMCNSDTFYKLMHNSDSEIHHSDSHIAEMRYSDRLDGVMTVGNLNSGLISVGRVSCTYVTYCSCRRWQSQWTCR